MMRKLVFMILCLAFCRSVQAQVSGVGQLGCTNTPISVAAINSGTATGAVYTSPFLACTSIEIVLDQTTTITGGALTFQEDAGDGNFVTMDSWRLVDPTTTPFATIGNPYSFVASTNKQFLIMAYGLARIRLNLTSALTGTGAVTPFVIPTYYMLPLAFQATNSNLNVSATFPSAQPVSGTVAANQGTAAASTAGWPVTGGNLAETTAAWTSATGSNTTLRLTITGYNSVEVFFNQTTTLTGGVATFEASDTTAFTNAYPVQCSQANNFITGSTYTFVASTNQAYDCDVSGMVAFQVRLSTTISGTGTVNVGITGNAMGTVPEVAVGGTVTANAGTGIFQVSPTTAANTATNPFFDRPTDGTNPMGLMSNFGTAPGAVSSLNVNANIFSAGLAITSGAPLFTTDSADGSVSPGAAGTKSMLGGCLFNATLPTPANGQQVAFQCDQFGRLITSPQTTTSFAQALVAQVPGTNVFARAVVAGTFGRPVTSTGDAIDVNVKYAPALPQPSSSSQNALTPFRNAAVTAAQIVKSSPGNLYAWMVYNPNASACFLDFFNTTAPTLGTTVPVWTISLPATSAANVAPGQFAFANFSTAISVAAVTATGGASTCGTGAVVSLDIQ